MPEQLLTILKFFFLALVWLFFVRVLRVVWAEISTPAPALVTAGAGSQGAGRGAPTLGRLRVVEPAAAKGRTYDLGDELTIGRADGCAVALAEDKTVSQLHARVFRRDGRLWLEDLGSTNGTYLNAKKVGAPVALSRGDRVTVGRTVLEVTK